MKNLLITFGLMISTLSMGFSQVRLDVVVGISPKSNPVTADLFVNRQQPSEEFHFNLQQVDGQFLVVAKGLLQIKAPIFVDFGLGYTKRKQTYQAHFALIDVEHPIQMYYFYETEHVILLPINIGVNLGIFDVTSGFRAIHSIARETNLPQLNGFRYGDNSVQAGWQGSAGLSFQRFRIGIEYQGNLSRVGKDMYVNDQSLELMLVPGQFLFTIQKNL